MKKCCHCKNVKPSEDFHKNKHHKDGLSSICKDCQHIYVNNHYKNNKQYYIDKANKTTNNTRKWFKKYKNGLSCSNCKINHPAVLDFHHIADDKEYVVSQMIAHGKSKIKILEEIQKCIVLCANCHRILHYDKANGCDA